MLCSNGFRRRGGISSKNNLSRVQSQHNDRQIQTNFHKSIQVKFSKINQNNHAILKNRKKQLEFQKTIQEIINRKCTFYKLGFKNYQKSNNKKIFGDVFGLRPAQMKGTMQIGQLWSSHQSKKFLKQNKIYMTKLKLMDKLQQLRKDFDQKELNRSQTNIQSAKSFGSTRFITHQSIYNNSGVQQGHQNKIKMNEAIQNLKQKLKTLTKTSSLQCFNNDISYLQKCHDKLQRVERQYFLKMIQIQ